MFVGRIKEQAILTNALKDDKAHFIAVYGRRRIGKTYLVRHSFEQHILFQHAGIFGGKVKEQLFAFDASLKEAGFIVEQKSNNWMEAFENLKDLIRLSNNNRKVIFIDELSWMDTRGCDLMRALEAFWNGWASARDDVVLVICASATSWMISKVVHNKGGLYNRLTEQIGLQPFSLSDCLEYVEARKLPMTRNQILQCYMVFGGIPYYWDLLRPGQSLAQNIDSLLFARRAPLRDEFKYLYASIYKNPEVHFKLIEALGRRKSGLTREELIQETGVANSGDLTHKLEELESCGFIRKYHAFGKKKKDAIYQLIDFFTIFYYSFMVDRPTDEHFWSSQMNTPTINAWQGLAFERVCLAHTMQIKSALGIAGVLTEELPVRCGADASRGLQGSQIDLAIVRRDRVINLCEMKYSACEYAVTAETVRSIERKAKDLAIITNEKYAIMPVLIAAEGVVENEYALSIPCKLAGQELFQ